MNGNEQRDLEQAFHVILSTGGLVLGGISAEDKRERIRLAILERGLTGKPWPLDRAITYGQAFERCYKRKVEMRRMQRDAENRPMNYKDFNDAKALRGPGEDDDAGEDDDDEGASP